MVKGLRQKAEGHTIPGAKQCLGSKSIFQIFLLRLVVPNLLSVGRTVQLGFMLHAVQFACFGLVKSRISQWILLVVTSPGSMADPAIRSAIAERVSLP